MGEAGRCFWSMTPFLSRRSATFQASHTPSFALPHPRWTAPSPAPTRPSFPLLLLLLPPTALPPSLPPRLQQQSGWSFWTRGRGVCITTIMCLRRLSGPCRRAFRFVIGCLRVCECACLFACVCGSVCVLLHSHFLLSFLLSVCMCVECVNFLKRLLISPAILI